MTSSLDVSPFPPEVVAAELLEWPEPLRKIRSFVSGDPTGDRLRVTYWADAAAGEVRARVWLGPGAEGPPGHAHGGAIAAVLDEVMGVCAWYHRHRAVAARLTIDFQAPLPLGAETIAVARVTAVEGRRVTLEGRVETSGGRVHASASGLFVVVDAALEQRLRFGDGAK